MNGTTAEPDGAVDSDLPAPRPAVREALRRPVRFLLSAWPLRCWLHLLGGVLSGAVVLVVLVVAVSLGVVLSVIGVGLLLLVAVPLLGIPVAAVERRRLRLVEPARLPGPHSPPAAGGPWRWLRHRFGERATWRELGYAVLSSTAFTCAGLGVLALTALAAILVPTPVVVWALAPETVMVIPGEAIGSPLAALPFTALGVAGLALAAYAAGWLTTAQVRTAWFLLAPRDDGMTRRVHELTRSRVRLADAFEAERRRIERDLHDGAQQQLVALTMTLGLAEMELAGTESEAAALVARGRKEALRALGQLRELIRGIHPQVLTDHGLAAAVAEIAERVPVPVDVSIDLPHRLPALVETTAYFTVTEALANAAKHSGATEIGIAGRMAGDRLVLLITDDGRGGADPAAGTGLTGLADRLAILRGRLSVSSPAGGPTQLRVEVPCSV
ncbi:MULTISPECIES: sensor histidine kinase [unclassified Streptomyces]|uniref:sensor histidine kinase n=1 Tax=unclassified Streptomyces TaxID=2593676 RepID=UPI00211EACEA|nr:MULTISPECIES: sensor histidine kinase [unclassified Streptomyces]MCQ9706699.1 sensor domain-containing protein [Streptomyces sp. BSP1]UYX92651.1 sensor domain-containing protein [Streptomyces sp. BI87]